MSVLRQVLHARGLVVGLVPVSRVWIADARYRSGGKVDNIEKFKPIQVGRFIVSTFCTTKKAIIEISIIANMLFV